MQIKNFLQNYSEPLIIFRLSAVYFIALSIQHTEIDLWIRLSISILSFVSLLNKKIITNALFWFSISGLLSIPLIECFYCTNNHYFLATYFCFSLGLYSWKFNNSGESLKKTICALFLIVMGTTTMHKLMSESFKDGSVIYWYILQGKIQFLLINFFHSNFEAIISHNKQILNSTIINYELINRSFHWKTPNCLISKLSLYMSWIIIFFEGFLTCLFLFPAKFRKINQLKYIFLSLFLVGTYLMRDERTFLALISIFGFILCPKIYKTKYFFLFFSLLMIGLELINGIQ